MKNLNKTPNFFPLKVGLLMKEFDSNRFSIILEKNQKVENSYTLTTTEDVLRFFENYSINVLLIDIFTIGIDKSLDLISSIREIYSYAPIALIGTTNELLGLPNVPDKWAQRFSHFYKLPKDIDDRLLEIGLDDLTDKLEGYLQNSLASEDLRKVRNALKENFKNADQGLVKDISSKLKNAENVLEAKKYSTTVSNLIQGFEGEDIKKLVTDTLGKASKSLEGTVRANKLILVCGLSLVTASFVATCITQRLDIMAFGGLGIAGVIASLITNPIKSIGTNARQIIQIQVAYLGFLKQLALLDAETQASQQISPLEKSRQLNEAIEKILKVLNDNFS